MTGSMRILLIVGAFITMAYMIYQIRKSRMQISNSIFWASFSGFLMLVALFPELVLWAAKALNIMSPINILFLFIIFILIIRLFSTSLRICYLEQQLQRMAQHIALHEAKDMRRFKALQDGEDIAAAEYEEKE